MRSQLITALQGFDKTTLGTFSVVSDLPWLSDGNPLYVKNLKKIYVAAESSDLNPIVDTLDGTGIAHEIVTVNVYYACDAKTLPSNFDTLNDAVNDLRLDLRNGRWQQRRVNKTTELDADMIIVTQEFTFERIVEN